MSNGHETATKADLEALREQLEAHFGKQIEDMEDRLVSAIRDTETKLLTSFYDFAKANQQRVSELEGSDANIKRRIGTLEDRLLEVEKRLNMPPAA